MASCKPPSGDTVLVDSTRPATERDRRIKVGATAEERFPDVFGPARPAAAGTGDMATGLEGAFAWDAPAGWTEQPPQGSMRLANLTFGPDGSGECYFGVLGGAGGGLLANVNRWRGQMGLEPVDEAAVDALPERTFFRRAAKFIDVEGTFTSMGGAPKPGYRMLGLIHSGPQFTLYAKLTGPTELVAGEVEAFEQFAASLRLAEGFEAGEGDG
jgi:hypothetical protein